MDRLIKHMRKLIIICDTEGKLSKSTRVTGCHDATFFVVGTCKLNKHKAISNVRIQDKFDVFSLLTVPGNKISKLQKRMLPILDYHRVENGADGYILAGWSAYDKNMLSPILEPLNSVHYLDLLQVSRKEFKFINEFSISSLLERYQSKCKQKHFSFNDTLHTIKIIKCLMNEKKNGKRSTIQSSLTNCHLQDFLKLDHIPRYLNEIDYKKSGRGKGKQSLHSSFSSSSYSLSEVMEMVNFKNYDLIQSHTDETFYKVRRGWERLHQEGYKGKGLHLFIPDTGEFKVIKDQQKKIEILDNFIEFGSFVKFDSPLQSPIPLQVKPPVIKLL